MDGYLNVLRGNHFDSVGGYWTTDAQMFEKEMEMNRTSFDAMVAEVAKTMKLDSMSLTTNEIFAHDGGTVAYQYGRYTEATHYLAGKKPPEIARNNFVARWVKEGDGVWRMSRFVATPQPLPTPALAGKK